MWFLLPWMISESTAVILPATKAMQQFYEEYLIFNMNKRKKKCELGWTKVIPPASNCLGAWHYLNSMTATSHAGCIFFRPCLGAVCHMKSFADAEISEECMAQVVQTAFKTPLMPSASLLAVPDKLYLAIFTKFSITEFCKFFFLEFEDIPLILISPLVYIINNSDIKYWQGKITTIQWLIVKIA